MKKIKFGLFLRRFTYNRCFYNTTKLLPIIYHDTFDFKFNNYKITPLLAGVFSIFKQTDKEEETEDDIENDPEELMGRVMDSISHNNFEVKPDLIKIQSLIDEAFKSGKLNKKDYHGKCAFITSTWSNILLMKQDLPQAEGFLKKTIQHCIHADVKLAHETILELTLKLGLVQSKLKKYEEAQVCFLYTIKNAEEELNEKKLTDAQKNNFKTILGMSCNYYSKFLFDVKKYDEALKYAEKALIVAKEIYKENHSNILSILNDLGAMHLRLENYKEAENKFTEALKLNDLKPDNANLYIMSVIYANYAQLYMHNKQFDEAENMCGKSKESNNIFTSLLKTRNSDKVNHVKECYEMLAGAKSAARED